MECRTSGLTDHEWCLQHDIKPGTFYNWVKRLRKAGCPETPNAAGNHHSPRQQDVVKIELTSPDKSTGNLIPSFQCIEVVHYKNDFSASGYMTSDKYLISSVQLTAVRGFRTLT